MIIDSRQKRRAEDPGFITAYLYDGDRGVQMNVIVTYRAHSDEVEFLEGPYQTGNWGYDSGGITLPASKIANGDFPEQFFQIPPEERETILAFLSRERHAKRIIGGSQGQR